MKNKKSIAIAMAAVSSFGAVAPVFANEIAPKMIVNGVDVAKAEGNKVEVLNYGQVYDTHFTADKKDDTIKKGLTILDIISDVESEEKYLVARAYTIEDIRKSEDDKKEDLEKELAKMIAQEKANLEDTINDIKHKLTLSFINEKGEKKALYSINEKKSGEVQAEDTESKEGNYYSLVLTNNQTKEDEKAITFTNIKVEEKVEEEKVEVIKETINLLDAAYNRYEVYNKLSKYAFELELAKNIIVETKEVTPTTLEVKVLKNDEKKTHVATLTIAGMNKFESDKFKKISTTGDFVGHWAQDQIVDAMVNGQVDLADNYRPQDGVTRAEFAKIACTVFGIDVEEGQDEPFHDVANGKWYQKYIAALYNKKVGGQSVVQGDGENFRPDDKITRQEVAVIVSKLVSDTAKETTIDVNGAKVDKDVKTNFKDDDSIATWADESVRYLNETAKYTNDKDEEKSIVEGSNGYFNPTQDITRAEALVMVQRAASATTK